VVCFDEACKQLFGEVRPPQPAGPGGRRDRTTSTSARGSATNWSVRAADGLAARAGDGAAHPQGLRRVPARVGRRSFPGGKKIRVVQDNLNTHDGASLYEAFPAGGSAAILEKLEFHYTPKHGSWLNLAESEISIMNGQCLGCRLEERGGGGRASGALGGGRGTPKGYVSTGPSPWRRPAAN